MKTLHHAIEIERGLGNIRFGSSTQDVRQWLGAPDETETLDPGTESTVMWYYAREKLQIIFQRPVSPPAWDSVSERIVQLTTNHPATTLWGTKIIGRTEDDVLTLFRKQGYTDFIVCGCPGDTSAYKSLRIDSVRVSLGFQDGLLRFILWGHKL
jgi:hypothetical protein